MFGAVFARAQREPGDETCHGNRKRRHHKCGDHFGLGADFSNFGGKTDHDGNGTGAGDAGHGNGKEGIVFFIAAYHWGVVGTLAAEQHLVTDHGDDEAARNTHGTVADAEEGEKQVSGDEAHEHHEERIDRGPVGLLMALFARHADR